MILPYALWKHEKGDKKFFFSQKEIALSIQRHKNVFAVLL
jgi:hypothetical protein